MVMDFNVVFTLICFLLNSKEQLDSSADTISDNDSLGLPFTMLEKEFLEVILCLYVFKIHVTFKLKSKIIMNV